MEQPTNKIKRLLKAPRELSPSKRVQAGIYLLATISLLAVITLRLLR